MFRQFSFQTPEMIIYLRGGLDASFPITTTKHYDLTMHLIWLTKHVLYDMQLFSQLRHNLQLWLILTTQYRFIGQEQATLINSLKIHSTRASERKLKCFSSIVK